MKKTSNTQNNKNKLIFTLLFSIFISISTLSAQNKTDIPITNAINNSNWFEVRDIYEQSKDSLSDYMRLTAEMLIDYNFNNPAGVVEKVQMMHADYSPFFAPNFFPYFAKMTDCLGYLGMYKEAYEVSNSLYQGKDQMDENTSMHFKRNIVLFKFLSNYPAPKLIVGNKEEVVPFKIVERQILMPLTLNDIPTTAFFDTGGGTSVITKAHAKKLGLQIFSDSLILNQILTPIVVIDSIMVGETLITNLHFAIMENDEKIYNNADVIIGTSMIQLFPEFVLDYKNKNLIFKNYLPKRENTPRNLCFDQMPYVKVNVEGVPAIFLWDTGGAITLIKDVFYEKHKALFPKIGKTKSGVSKGIGTDWEVKGAKIPNVKIEIAGKTGFVKQALVLEQFDLFNWFEIPIDGFIGADLKGIDRLILSYQGMYLIAE